MSQVFGNPSNVFDGLSLLGSKAALDAASDYMICPSSTNTLTSDTSNQPLFDDVGGGILTIPVGLYFFECFFVLTSMSATAGNGAFDVKGASGTATFTTAYFVVGSDLTSGATATRTGSTSATSTSLASVVTAGTSTALEILTRGMLRVTVTGTIIPSFQLVTAASAVRSANSYFTAKLRHTDPTTQIIGPWT